jgi:membrane protein CcdC involved in cytochrome C biogenesis
VKLIWHVLLTAVFAYIFSGLYSCWWLPLVILVSHYLIDVAKSYLPDKFIYFIADQLMHLLVIMIVWLCIYKQWPIITTGISSIAESTRFWILAFGYVLVTWPFGILIGLATAKWRKDLEANKEAQEGLEDAGKWIGICERMLILTFVLTSQYTAIGFLITAKSILRFGDKDKKAEKKTEYILVGTLLSFAASALLGVAISYAIRQ